METYTVEVSYQPTEGKAHWAEGNIKQTYTFTRAQLDGIVDAYDLVASYPARLGIEDLKTRTRVAMSGMTWHSRMPLPMFGGKYNCGAPGKDIDLMEGSQYIIGLDQLKRYLLSVTTPRQTCIYTFDDLSYLQGFFWVLHLFGLNPRNYALHLYDNSIGQEIPVPYPA